MPRFLTAAAAAVLLLLLGTLVYLYWPWGTEVVTRWVPEFRTGASNDFEYTIEVDGKKFFVRVPQEERAVMVPVAETVRRKPGATEVGLVLALLAGFMYVVVLLCLWAAASNDRKEINDHLRSVMGYVYVVVLGLLGFGRVADPDPLPGSPSQPSYSAPPRIQIEPYGDFGDPNEPPPAAAPPDEERPRLPSGPPPAPSA